MKQHETSYHAFKEHVEYRRSSDQNFSSFVVEYKKRYTEVNRYKLNLTTGVQAFFFYKLQSYT